MIIHEQDLRGALGKSGGQHTDGLAAIREMMLDRFTTSLEDRSPSHWCSSGDPAEAATVVIASDFDPARALMSRRSASQLRAWTTHGDVTPYLDALASLGDLPRQPLSE